MNEDTPMQFNTEGQPAFPVANEGDDTPSDSSPVEEGTEESTDEITEETNETDQTPSSEESTEESHATEEASPGSKEKKPKLNTPPAERWQEREKDWKDRYNAQELRHSNDIKKLSEEIAKGNKPAPKADDAPEEIPSWFGGDEKQWQSFLAHNARERAKSEASLIKTLKEAKGKEEEQVQEATDYMSEQMSFIQTDKDLNPNGIKVDKNKLLKFVLDNDLVDSKGRWNYKAGWRMMNATTSSAKPKVSKDKKEIAGAVTSEKKAETKSSDTTTSKDFENPSNRPW